MVACLFHDIRHLNEFLISESRYLKLIERNWLDNQRFNGFKVLPGMKFIAFSVPNKYAETIGRFARKFAFSAAFYAGLSSSTGIGFADLTQLRWLKSVRRSLSERLKRTCFRKICGIGRSIG